MATQHDSALLSLPASGDLSAKQYYAVEINSSGQVAVAGAGEVAVGILQDKPEAAGDICAVAPLDGQIHKAYAGAAITAGAQVTPDANGELVTATTGNYVIGIAVDSAADGDVFRFIALPIGVTD